MANAYHVMDCRAVPYAEDMPLALPPVTFEANLGVGAVAQVYNGPDDNFSDISPDGYCATTATLGAGAFVRSDLAITARFAIARYAPYDSIDAMFIGVSAQYWLRPAIWLGGGVGMMVTGNSDDEDTELHNGNAPALDLRAGIDLARSEHAALNVSLELTPGLYTTRFSGDRTAILGIVALAVGVQLM